MPGLVVLMSFSGRYLSLLARVGTDRPARWRRAATALNHPVTPGPLLPGRLRPTVYSPNTDSNPCTGCTQSHLLTRLGRRSLRPQPRHSRQVHRELRVARTVCQCLARSPRAACQTHAAPLSPRGTRGYHPPSRLSPRLRGGGGASRRRGTRFAGAPRVLQVRASLAPCPPGPSRMCPGSLLARHGPHASCGIRNVVPTQNTPSPSPSLLESPLRLRRRILSLSRSLSIRSSRIISA